MGFLHQKHRLAGLNTPISGVPLGLSFIFKINDGGPESCCSRAFSSCGELGYSSSQCTGFLTAGASLVAEHGLSSTRASVAATPRAQ